MTLREVQKAVEEAIKGRGDPNKPIRLTTETIDSESYKQVLILLGPDMTPSEGSSGILFSGDVKTELIRAPNDKLGAGEKEKLTIQGDANVLGRTPLTTIALTDRGNEKRTDRICVVDIGSPEKPFGTCQPADLETPYRFTLKDGFVGASVREREFAITSFQAKSDALKMRISGSRRKGEQEKPEVILESPAISVMATNFALETFLFPDWTVPDVRFEASGEFQLGEGKPATLTLSLPVGTTTARNLYRATLTKAKVDLSAVAGCVGITEMFEQAPSELSKGLSFGLERLTIDFYRQPLRIGTVRVVISIEEPWEIVNQLKLNRIALHVETIQPFTPASRIIFLYVSGRFRVGKVNLEAVASFAAGSRSGAISFSSLEEFALENLSGFLGGSVLETLEIPGTSVKTTAIEVRLSEFSSAFSLNAPGEQKLQAIRLAVAMRLKCNLIPGVLLISDPNLSFDIADPLNPPTRELSVQLAGTLSFLEELNATFEMKLIEGRWILAAEALEEIRVANIFGVSGGEERLGVDFPENLPLSKELAALTLSGLQARYATQTVKYPAEFSFSATVVKIPEFKLGKIAVNVQSLSVELLSGKKDNEQRQTSMILKGAFLFDTVPLSIAFNYQRGRERSWRVMIEALGFRGEYSTTGKTAKLDLGNRNVGEILRDVYSLVEPSVTIRLPEPWNELERISLQGASLIFDFEKRGFGVTYEFQSEVPLVFARLKKIGINYAGGRSVRITVEGRLFNEANDRSFSFDPRNPGPLPLPATKAAPIDLRFLALGQRLRLKTNDKIPEIKRVRDALGLMKEAFSKDNPSELLLAKDSGLTFDPQSGLLVGADFSLLGTLSTALVFNDGVVAGVSLGLSGTRARYFSGLDFEILYKKVAEGIGVYQTEVRLPDSVRQIELGPVSMTIPELALQIYTNGNFRVDLGFPRNNDFSRSFQLQVFPYLGKGGFYFARLEGRTAPRLPADYDPRRGKFDPVLAFGLGLSIGIGKSINRGVLAAELSVSFEGIVEGVLAFFTAERIADKPIGADSLYHWAQGTLGIVGRIRGRASFSVITAEVSLVVESRIGIMLESFRPLMLTFTAAVNVDLVVRIGAGWLSVDISCSFSTTISERLEFPVRNPGLPAWAPQPGAPALSPSIRALLADTLAAPDLGLRALAGDAPRPLPEMTWNPIISDETPEELRLLFRPQFTVAEDKKENQMMKVPPQTAHCVALLFLKSVGTADKVEEPAEPIAVANPAGSGVQNMPSDFDRLAEAMLLWCINSLLNHGAPTSRKEILEREISTEDLERIYRVLTCRPDGAAPFTGAQVIGFLRTYFDIVIQAEQRPLCGIDPDEAYYDRDRPVVAAFPMIPELRVEARLTVEVDPRDSTKNFELLHYSARFDKQTVVQSSYHREIAQHFESMAPEFRTELEKATDKAAADPPPEELAAAGGRSIAEFVFEDYFLMIARDVVQSSLDLIKTRSHLHTTGDETLVNLATHFGVSIERIVAENPRLKIGEGLAIQVSGATTTTTAGDSFSAISARFGERSNSSLVEEIGRANSFVPGLLTAGVTITAGEADTSNEVEYTVEERDTLDSVSKALRLEGGAGELSSLIALSSGYINSGIRLLVPIYARRQTAGRTTLADLAEVFTGISGSEAKENIQFARDLGALNAYVKDVMVPGTILTVSTESYTVRAGDTLASIAAGNIASVTPMDILEANRFKAGIFREDVEITIPPTSRLSGDTDTLQSVAMQMGVPVGLLAANNAHMQGFLASGQQLSFPSIKVETLFKELRVPSAKGPNKLLNLSGMVSRFMMPGIRLPRPSSLLKDERKLWPGMGKEGAPLYAMTGQQFELPEFGEKYVRCMIDLIPPKDGYPFQYVMTGRKLGGGNQGYTEDEEVEKLTIELQKNELDWIDELREATLAIRLKPFQIPMSLKDKEGKPRDKDRCRFAVSDGVKFMGSLRFSLGANKDNPLGAPTVWMLPEGFRRTISEARDRLSAFKLEAGEQTSENGEVTFREADAYGWATALNVRIRKIVLSKAPAPSSDPPQPPKLNELAYEIDGADAEGVLLLQEILRRAGPKFDDSFIKEVRILYPATAIDGAPALASKDPAGISAFILQTNLSTLTSPRSSTAASLAPATAPIVSKSEMLRLLLQASIVRSGGYYLFYQTNDPVEGLPAEIFNNATAEITILITFDFQIPDQKHAVASFVNRAFVDDKGLLSDAKLFATSLDLFVKQPLLPPGHTGIVVRRAQPVRDLLDIDPLSSQQLEFLYSLLACRVAEDSSFRESVEVPADGPEGMVAQEFVNGFPVNELIWQYTKVIPAFRFFKPDPLALPAELAEARRLLPDPYGNPYRGVGHKLPVRLDWLDGFGNKIFWPSDEMKQPVEKPVFPLQLGYTDELIGVERWPAVSAGYAIEAKDITKPELAIMFDFDVSRYTPRAEGQGSLADAKRVAKADLEVFRKVFYQLTDGNTKIKLHTTIDNESKKSASMGVIDNQSGRPVWKNVIGFIGDIIRYLTLIAAPEYKFRYGFGVAPESLERIADRFAVNVDELRRLNPELPDVLVESTEILLPDLSLPNRLRLSRPMSLSNTEPLFPLAVRLVLERVDRTNAESFVDKEFRDVPGVKFVAHEVEPLAVVAGNGGGRANGAIREFAQKFEGVFENTKLATGLARASDAESDSRNRLWVVRIGSAITYKVDPTSQHFFAPIPLATTLLGATDLAVLAYNKESQELGKTEASYAGIDLDEWARRFLSAMDTFFLPQYALSAYALESNHCKTIIEAKRDIASSIADSVEGIAEGTGGDRDQARELLRQRMLLKLSAAYDVDAIVQIGVLVESPFDFIPESAPMLYGQPVAKLPAPGPDQPPEKPDFTLSTAKIPLVDGPSYLTFLFDSEKVEPEQLLKLNLSYSATALEHEISDVPGVKDLKSSSWLTFIIPENVIPNDKPIEVKVPIPIRADPIRPSIETQAVDRAYPDGQDLKLEETRQYAYSYEYSRGRSAHDLVYTSPRFNSVKPAEEGKRDSVSNMDLFQALASFDGTWDAIRQDLLGTLPELKSADTPKEVETRALNALKAFAKLASLVATAWKSWNEKEMPSLGPSEPGDRYKYEQKQMRGTDDYVISEGKSEKDDSWQITVRRCNAPADAPIPGIEIKDWEQVEIEPANSNERRFQFKADGVSMTAEDVEDGFNTDNKIIRAVVFKNTSAASEPAAAKARKQAGLDILNNENAWPELRITRNETLFGDVACREGSSPRTNPSFVYRTPLVRFAEILKPRLEYGRPIDIAKMLAEKDKDSEAVLQRPLEDHLSRLFKRFFESAGKLGVKRRMQLTCRYQYDLNEPANQNDLLVITVPIVMAPPFDFIIPDGKNAAGKPFPQSLTEAIKAWLDERHPSGKNARFVFDISVYSGIGAAKLPVYRITNLQLGVKKDQIKGEWICSSAARAF